MKKVAFASILSAAAVNLLSANPSSAQLPQTAYQCSLNGGRSPWYYVTWFNGWNKFNLGTSQGRDGLWFEKQGDYVKEKSGKAYRLSLLRKGNSFVLSSLDGTAIYECDI